jgi:ribose 5-phosphate isomerase A
MSDLKMQAAQAAMAYIKDDMVLGVGTGSTVNYFIQELAKIKHRIEACVASSKATEDLLRAHGIPVIDLNATKMVDLYVDGADEVNPRREMIKGGGGALTREKILATAASQFICIVDESKKVGHLGEFPLAIEVLQMARSFVARQLVQLGGSPEYRQGFVTDNGHIILDVFQLKIETPMALEDRINQIPGVVENGIFAHRVADRVLIAGKNGIDILE